MTPLLKRNPNIPVTIAMEDIEKAELIVDDGTVKRRYLSKMYFLLGLHFTVISAAAFCLYMTPGVRPFVQQHAYMVPLFLVLMVAALAVNKFASREFDQSILLFVILTVAATLALSSVALYLDTENGFLITGILAISWFLHSMTSGLGCIRSTFTSSVALSPFFIVLSSLFLIETIGLFSFNIFINAPVSFLIMIYILNLFHGNSQNYLEETLIGFRTVYPDVFCCLKK